MKTYAYSQLPAATIDFLKRLQRDEAKGDAIVVSISSKSKFAYWLVGGAILLLSSIACFHGETSWWEIPCGFIGACAGIYCVLRSIWEMIRQILHEFRDGLYITRLHVIRTDPLGVHVAPLSSISDIAFLEYFQNGQYSWTGLSFSYDEHERGAGTVNDRSLAILTKERLQEYLDDLKNAGENANVDYFASNDLFANIPESPAVPDSRAQKRALGVASIVAGIILSAILWRWNDAPLGDPFPWADPCAEEERDGHGEGSDAKRTEDVRKDIRTVREMDHAVIPGPEARLSDQPGDVAIYYVTNALSCDIFVLVAGSKYANKVLVKKGDSAVMALPAGDYERCIILREKFRKRPRPAYTKCRFDAGIYSEGFVVRFERKLRRRWEKQGKTDWRQEQAEDKIFRECRDLDRRLRNSLKNIRPILIEPKPQIGPQSDKFDEKKVNERTISLPGGAKMEMVYCPPGEFMMGSSIDDNLSGSDEKTPAGKHKVRITHGFWLGKYEVTQEQWESVMGNNPSYFKSPTRPVEKVSWLDCQQFIMRVADEVKRQLGGYACLPTEAEWEYACRAGTDKSLPNSPAGKEMGIQVGNDDGLNEIAWYNGNSHVGFELTNDCPNLSKEAKEHEKADAGTHPVGRKAPNNWGIYDMIGNVREWCNDWYASGYYSNSDVCDPLGPPSGDVSRTFGECRVLRGGAWSNNAQLCRSAYRGWSNPGYHDCFSGFRLCCSAGPRE